MVFINNMKVVTIFPSDWGELHPPITSFKDIGVEPLNSFYEFEIVDEKKFFLYMLQHDIRYRNLRNYTSHGKCSA